LVGDIVSLVFSKYVEEHQSVVLTVGSNRSEAAAFASVAFCDALLEERATEPSID
jgi:hypothetical protein